ncbi:MAG: ATP-binding protein [Thermoplasmata archaeon]
MTEDQIPEKVFPFSAVVGLPLLKLALVLNLINKDIGGVLIKGDKGTGKSLTVNSFKNLLPDIRVVQGCQFNCSPDEPEKLCIECKEKAKNDKLRAQTKKMDIIYLPLNITEDRLIGTIDVEKVLQDGIKSFEPGLLARANRNILYIDQINLLDHHIVDLLLDVAAMKTVTVEREGISTDYMSDFMLVASMNPEEGFLRPQLLDRFSLQVETETIDDSEERLKLIKTNRDFLEDPMGMIRKYQSKDAELKQNINEAKERLTSVELSDEMLDLICRICREFGIDGHRGDIIISRASRTNAAYQSRFKTTVDDILQAAELALPHRMRKQPFEVGEFSKKKLRALVKEKWNY